MTEPPAIPPLEPLELEWYEVMLPGLLGGARRLVDASDCSPTVAEALAAAEDMVLELLARVRAEVESR